MRIRDIVGHVPRKQTVTAIPYEAHRIPDLARRDFTLTDPTIPAYGRPA
jgi:hypothetical protein